MSASTVYACPRCDREFLTSEECRAHIRGCRKASAIATERPVLAVAVNILGGEQLRFSEDMRIWGPDGKRRRIRELPELFIDPSAWIDFDATAESGAEPRQQEDDEVAPRAVRGRLYARGVLSVMYDEPVESDD